MIKHKREEASFLIDDYFIYEDVVEPESKRSKYEVISDSQQEISLLEAMMDDPDCTIEAKLGMYDSILTFSMQIVEREKSEGNVRNFKNHLEEYSRYYYSIMESNNDLALSYLGRLQDLQSYADELEIAQAKEEKREEIPMLPSIESIFSFVTTTECENFDELEKVLPLEIPIIEEVKLPLAPVEVEDVNYSRARSVVHKSVKLFQQETGWSERSKMYEKDRASLDKQILSASKALLSKAIEEKLADINYSLECLPTLICSNPEAKIEEYKKEQTTYLKQEKKFLGKLAVQFEKMHDICKEIDLLGENNFDYDL
jgi:hypothetical protein